MLRRCLQGLGVTWCKLQVLLALTPLTFPLSHPWPQALAYPATVGEVCFPWCQVTRQSLWEVAVSDTVTLSVCNKMAGDFPDDRPTTRGLLFPDWLWSAVFSLPAPWDSRSWEAAVLHPSRAQCSGTKLCLCKCLPISTICSSLTTEN